MKIEITLVRHGQSEANVENIMQGRGNAILTKLGKKQATSLQSAFTQKFDRIFVSPLDRAYTTAKIALERLHNQNEFVVMDELQEVDIGELEGISRNTQDPHYYSLLQNYRNDFDFKGHGGESKNELAQRLGNAFMKILNVMKKENDQRGVIFAHGGALQALIHIYLKVENAPEYLDNCQFITLTQTNGKWTTSD